MKLLFFSHNLNYALGWTVIHSLWQALLIALVTGIVLIILQKKSSNFRYVLANAGLWSVLFAAIITFFIYYDFSKKASELVFVPENKTSVLQFISQPKIDDIPTSFSYEANAGFSIAEMKNYFNQNMYFIVSLWFMGVIVFLVKILGSISYVYYLKNRLNFPAEEYWQDTLNSIREKTNITKYIDLVESALVRSPIVIGHLKPMILFPIGAINRLNTSEVEAILAHELAHVMRHDYFFNILQSVIEALFYFHPAVWWLSSQIRTERENCCDDIAISLCGNAVTYAKSLVSVQEMAYFAPQMAMAFAGTDRKKHLLLRVQRIFNQPKSKINIMEKIAAICILFVTMAGFAFSNTHSGSNATNNNSTTKNLKNADNQQNTSSFYLKYEENGELDSIPLEKQIADGNYNFTNNLYDVNLTVKSQYVTQFKINGLEVDKKDMPKFQKMINQLVSAKDGENDEELDKEMTQKYTYESHNEGNTAMDITENTMKIIDDGVVSELVRNSKADKQILTVTKPNEKAIVVILDEKTNVLTIDGTKSNSAALKKLGWKIKGNNLQPLNATLMPPPPPPAPGLPPLPPLPPNIEDFKENERNRMFDYVSDLRNSIDELSEKGTKNEEGTSNLVKKLGDIEERINAETPQFEKIEKELNEINTAVTKLGGKAVKSKKMIKTVKINRVIKDNNENEAFDKWLVSELTKDGYIKNKNNYSFSWDNNSMSVDGKKVTSANREKYAAMYYKMTGEKRSSEFSMTKTYKSSEN